MTDPYRPYLVVTVDTEEDNWIPARDGITVDNLRQVPILQEMLEDLGVPPTYLVTYRVAEVPWAAELLAGLHHDGRAEVGAHLHPWNTPPLREPMDVKHHPLANLPSDLQREKLASLCSSLRDHLGVDPVSFRAGMWSLSRDTVELLIEEGFRVDTSVLPYMYWHDVPYSPSYAHAPARPYRLAPGRSLQRHHPGGDLLEVPATAGYTRGPWRLWGPVDRLFRTLPMVPLHVPGLLARAGIVERIALTPEQSSLGEMLALSEASARRRLPVLNVFLHSSALLPGATEFVRSDREREEFLARMRSLLEALLDRYDARPVRLGELADAPVASGAGRVDRTHA